MKKYFDFKARLRYGPKHGPVCYYCHVPPCKDRLHKPFVRGSTQACEYLDIVVPVVYAVLHTPKWLEEAAKEFGSTFSVQEDVVAWLMGAPVEGHSSNLIAMFLWHYNHQVVKGRV
jgi:hypothetical protein